MIRFNNVTYWYPFQKEPALVDINLHVAPGELVLVTGASGCGKSTLMRLANGLCPHHFQGRLEGQVLIGGENTLDRMVGEISRDVGTLFQDPEQQFFALNVEDELAFAHEWQGRSAEETRERIHTAAERFGIAHLMASSILELSEGQKQKVGLASLLSRSPRALILDEPTANLDPEATVDLAQKMTELKRQGMAILVVDHRLYWLEGIADRVLVMQKGRICEEGDYALLRDDDLRERYGLRAASVKDVRPTLPDCSSLPEMENGKGLAVRGLDFAYPGSKPLFTRASVRLQPGVIALIGDNGMGKTTLARLLTGLNKAQAGEFFVDGQVCPQNKLLAHVGIVLQNADHQLHMKTVRRELEVCLELAGNLQGVKAGKEHKADVEAETAFLVNLFALNGLEERHPQSLSGGEKQRLVIACAFARHPDVLILDEPTSGLDGRNMQRIAEALQLLANRGVCVVVITHDLELLERSCRSALRLPLPVGEAPDGGEKDVSGE